MYIAIADDDCRVVSFVCFVFCKAINKNTKKTTPKNTNREMIQNTPNEVLSYMYLIL